MARILLVGCGCRGCSLARELAGAGHAVRATTRDPARLAEIEAERAEAVVADPDRLGTIMVQLGGVSVLCWLLGSAIGDSAEALHAHRLRTLLERLVDTPVRGFVYEGAGSVDPGLLAAGAGAVREASATWRIPVEVVEADPGDPPAWLAQMTAAVGRLLAR